MRSLRVILAKGAVVLSDSTLQQRARFEPLVERTVVALVASTGRTMESLPGLCSAVIRAGRPTRSAAAACEEGKWRAKLRAG